MSSITRACFLREEVKVATDLSQRELGIKLFRVTNRSTKKHARLLHSITERTINRHLGYYPRAKPMVTDFKEPDVPKLELVPILGQRRMTGSERRSRERAIRKERHFTKRDKEKAIRFRPKK